MISTLRAVTTALAACAALGVAAAAASASTPASLPASLAPLQVSPPGAAGGNANGAPCAGTVGPEGQGNTGGSFASVCQGEGLAFVSPAIGQVGSVIGPTIIAPAAIGNVVVSAGSGTAGP